MEFCLCAGPLAGDGLFTLLIESVIVGMLRLGNWIVESGVG